MNSKNSVIQADFDRLALFDAEGWNHNQCYHDYLLAQIPSHCGQALEIGCGSGSFSRLLSQKAEQVLALDLSPKMIEIARQRSLRFANIDYQVVDVMEWEFPREGFNCILTIATLHHLPFEEIVLKMKSGLKSNGVLVVLDLYQQEGIRDLLLNIFAVPTHLVLMLKNTGRIRERVEIQDAWAEHGKHDTYLPVSGVRKICADLLPGAEIKKHLLWRYSIVWQKSGR